MPSLLPAEQHACAYQMAVPEGSHAALSAFMSSVDVSASTGSPSVRRISAGSSSGAVRPWLLVTMTDGWCSCKAVVSASLVALSPARRITVSSVSRAISSAIQSATTASIKIGDLVVVGAPDKRFADLAIHVCPVAHQRFDVVFEALGRQVESAGRDDAGSSEGRDAPGDTRGWSNDQKIHRQLSLADAEDGQTDLEALLATVGVITYERLVADIGPVPQDWDAVTM